METFVVRVWIPGAPERREDVELVRLHGFVEHIGSGRSSAFKGLDELQALLLSAARPDREGLWPDSAAPLGDRR